MNPNMQKFLLAALLTLFFIISIRFNAVSQPPPPPADGGNNGHNFSGNQGAGEGAPVGEGIWIMLSLAFSYGAWWQMRNRGTRVYVAGKMAGEFSIPTFSPKIEMEALMYSGSLISGNNKLLSKYKFLCKRNFLLTHEVRRKFSARHRSKSKVIV
jgi:hypothetical protein